MFLYYVTIMENYMYMYIIDVNTYMYTDRLTERQTERQTDRRRDRQRGRQTERQTDSVCVNYPSMNLC